jgi:hypothetical protein
MVEVSEILIRYILTGLCFNLLTQLLNKSLHFYGAFEKASFIYSLVL